MTKFTFQYGNLYLTRRSLMKKRNKFWALTMAVVLTGGSSEKMQRLLSKKLQSNPELVSKILEEYPEDFVKVTEILLEKEMAKTSNS